MTENERPIRQVAIANVNMPFMALVGLMVKAWLATIVAALVLAARGGIGVILAMVILGAGRR